MNNVGKYILGQIKNQNISPEDAKVMLMELRNSKIENNEDIAIIGVSCKLPNSENVDEFWENIISGRNCFVTKPPEKMLLDELFKNPYYADLFDHDHWKKEDENVENFVGGYIKDFDKFDANFFGIPPREARYIDPQQRIFMEVAWAALEDAGFTEKSIRDSMTGIYVGRDGTNSNTYIFHTEYDKLSVSGNWSGILASRLNYLYNLKGPAMIIDTACSAGMVAIHEACAAIRNNECEMAIAGGISIGASGAEQEKKATDKDNDDNESTVVSDDNMIRTFDKNCSGTVFSEGCTVIILKPLNKAIEDRNQIYGIIKGSAINSDGASNGLTAPNPIAQENVIVDAWKRAHINPENIDFVETHGTGTLLGDPIEVLGLTNAFKHYTDKKQFCGVGSVKTNIGHTVAAAGVTNIVKIVLGMRNEVMPPTRNFSEPNPHINFIDSPVYVVDKPIEWKRGTKPRIAGASAWGFSGTNCHTVIQEPPSLEKTVNSKPINILTISAKTETAMKSFVENYYNFFKKRDSMNLEDVCFTSNIGRGHYSYRVAIIAESYEDLKEKISYLYKEGLKTSKEKNIYYSIHQVVPEKKKQRVLGDITEKEINVLSKEGKEYLSVLTNPNTTETEYKNNASSLCNCYVQGANIDWSSLYEGEKVRIVSLPTYPFDRISFWGEKRDIQIKDYNNVKDNSIKHDFIDCCLIESVNQTIYGLKFDLRTQWPLQEHILVGNNVVSGTTYIDILKQAFEIYYKTKKIEFDNITFLNTLIVTAENPYVEGHLIINKEDSGESFLLASKHIDENGQVTWIEHVKGKAHIHSDEDIMYPTMKDISESDKTEKLKALTISGFGERWNCIDCNFKDITSDNKVFYSFIKLPDKFLDDLKTYTYHPGMLDNAVNMIIFQIFTGTDFYIPFTYKSMKIFRDLPSYFYSKIERHDSGIGSEVIAFSVTLVDPEGRLLAKIDECTVKKVNKFNDYFSCNFYGTKWLETDSIESNQENVTGNVLIFADKDGIAEALTAKIQNSNNTIYKISFSNHYEKIDENNYSISGSIDDYDRLLDDLRITTISKVYHLASIDFKKNYYSYSDFEVEMNKGVYSLVYMNKIFTKRVKGLIDFVVVSDNTYKVIENEDCYKPANTSFFGLIKALKYECPSFTFKCVDIDRNSDKEFIINTIINSNNDSDTIAVRNNMHYTEVLDSFDTSNVLKKEVDVLEEGIYLITGGTGGLGLVMATNLSEFAHCNLCLLSRKEIPSRNLWDEIIANNEDVKLCNLIKNVRNIEERGCNVVFKKSDVSDKETMKVIINELRSEYGRINGVIHCAGVAGEGFNLTKPIDVFEKVINPKVYGSIVLGELLKDEALDFFIMFSSMTSILGGPGQGDYAAANAFLDGYANYLCMNGLQAQAINWPGWSETGMAVDYNIADAITLFKSLNNQFGVSIFNRIIRTDLTNIIPGNINLQFIQKIGLERLPIRLSKQLRKEFDRFQAKNETAVSNTMAMTINPADIVLKGKSEDEYTETERTIAYIYASVLNLPEIDVFDNFSSMGGDSIISTEVFKILNQQFNGVLSISDIFLYPTVESIAEYVDSLMNQDEKKEEIESFSNVIDKFEQGEVDIDSVINFLDEK